MKKNKLFDVLKNQRGINMVDLMMWLVIAALLLAAAIQGIGYYQQSAYLYQAKSDLNNAHSWAAAKVAETSKVPTAAEMQKAFADGDLKLTSDNLGIISASGGATYCIGIKSPPISQQNTVYSSSNSPSAIVRGPSVSSECGTATAVSPAGPNAIGTTTSNDVDADGQPNTSDTDIDNDGIPNATDPDIDGDGIPNASDGSPNGGIDAPPPGIRTGERLKFGLYTTGGILTDQIDRTSRLVNEYPGLIATTRDWTSQFNKTEVDAIIGKGAQPLVTWMPYVAGSGTVQANYELKDIYNGNHDAYIKTWTDSIAATSYNKPILISFAPEMNGKSYPWSQEANGNAAGDYKKAWIHVYNKFTAAGIQDKVDFVWAPVASYPGSTPMWDIYPGNQYVDMTGVSGYNFGQSANTTWSSPTQTFGGSLWDIRHAYHQAEEFAPLNGKPIVITATGSVPSQGANSQQQWIYDLVTWFNNDAENGDIVGFVWTNYTSTSGDWTLDSSAATGEAMKGALANR